MFFVKKNYYFSSYVWDEIIREKNKNKKMLQQHAIYSVIANIILAQYAFQRKYIITLSN